MQHKKIPLADTKAFTPFFLDYIQHKESLRPFYHRFPDVESFKDQITEKASSYPAHHRQLLVDTLKKQYSGLTVPEAVTVNIERLSGAKTFTVTTGHQLNIFTGPLYFIYKIVTVINACKRLKKIHPDHDFVPVYWMASEDHDYDEIKYFRLYDKKYVWQTPQKGAVGRFDTRDIKGLLSEVPGDIQIFKDAYSKGKTLADAVRHYVNALFGNDGVVVLDPDNKTLKSLFVPVMQQDILQNKTLPLVEETNAQLEALGYKTQVFCRPINFFYLDKDIRSRIEKMGDRYGIVDTDLTFSEEELQKLISDSPEKFSPNVILRPLYQEWILPNLAYVGGPAENIYWLQLKKVFEHFKSPFPILMPRNFAMVVDHTIHRKIEKSGIGLGMLFEEKNFIFNHWTAANSAHDLTVGKERDTIANAYEQLKKKAEAIDVTLGPFVGAEATRVMNDLERIERKLLRAEKRRHAEKLAQIGSAKDALFPNGGLQERIDNFLNFYQRDKQFIAKLIDCFDPFDYQFNVLIYNGA